jgi:hypothetical protein
MCGNGPLALIYPHAGRALRDCGAREFSNPQPNPQFLYRNNKSMAHPNTLLEPPEAMLAINAIRTMLHYLDNKLK